MKRDWNIFKDILQGIADDCLADKLANHINAQDRDTYEYHLELLSQGGYVIQGVSSRNPDKYRMTFKGYDLFAILKSKVLFPKLREAANSVDCDITAQIIDTILPIIIKDNLKG